MDIVVDGGAYTALDQLPRLGNGKQVIWLSVTRFVPCDGLHIVVELGPKKHKNRLCLAVQSRLQDHFGMLLLIHRRDCLEKWYANMRDLRTAY